LKEKHAMCKLCDDGLPQVHSHPQGISPASRRTFLKAATVTGVAATGLDLFAAPQGPAADADDSPRDTGRPGRR
jgi:hypothetical protein